MSADPPSVPPVTGGGLGRPGHFAGQGEPSAVIADGSGYVAVGTVGAPDNYIPTVWLSPPGR